MSKKETQGIINTFKDAYKEIAPIIDAENPSQDEIDEAIQRLCKARRNFGNSLHPAKSIEG